MIGIPLGWVAANASEWFIHKYWLHGLGKDKESFWSFHWHDHHGASRKLDMEDPDYEKMPFSAWDPPTKEIVALLAGAAIHAPLFPVAPFYVSTIWYSAARYWWVHRKAHLDPEWAKEHLPWHYDHPRGPNQDANWCVTHPFFDHVMKTREPWLGTEEEIAGRHRRAHFVEQARQKYQRRKKSTPSRERAAAAKAAA